MNFELIKRYEHAWKVFEMEVLYPLFIVRFAGWFSHSCRYTANNAGQAPVVGSLSKRSIALSRRGVTDLPYNFMGRQVIILKGISASQAAMDKFYYRKRRLS